MRLCKKSYRCRLRMKKKTTYDLRTERMDYIFDTHAHYDDEAFDADLEEVLA